MITVAAISVSDKKGIKKTNIPFATLQDNFGIVCDVHAGFVHRQVSFLSTSSIEKMKAAGLDVKSGDFAENITLEGINIEAVSTGDILEINNVEFIVTQLGKICHQRCAIFYSAGDCVMPREGFFSIVKGNGKIKVGDTVLHHKKTKLTGAVITLSDRAHQGLRMDETGPGIVDFLKKTFEFAFIRYEVIADEKIQLENLVIDLTDSQKIDLIITNGSTGVAKRDIAPDVTEKIIERRLPGFEEAMRLNSFKKTPYAIISRAVCGTRHNSLIINLPGAPIAAIENLETISGAIEHTIKKLQGDTSDCGL